MRNLIKSNKFLREYKNLGHDAQTQCDAAIDVLMQSDDPRSIAYERQSTGFIYRFGSYRLKYSFERDVVEILELLRVGRGHSIY